MANFPTSLDALATNQPWSDGTTVATAALLNAIQGALDAVQTKVGVNSSAVATTLDFALRKAYVKVSDVKTNADGGASSATTWNTRVLNTEDNDAGSLCSLASNRVTLSAGTYRCRISCPGYTCGAHAARLRNVTAGTTLIQGVAMDSLSGLNRAEIVGEFTVAGSQALEVQHYTSASDAKGLGRKVFTDATPNVYTVAEFWKLY